MKVFITVEVEKGDLDGAMSEPTYAKLMNVIHSIRKEGIPVQYKETDIPRRYRPLKDLPNIE